VNPDPGLSPTGPTTVAICTKGRKDCLTEAVGSVLVDADEEVELIVVDQNDDDRVAQALAAYSTDTRLRHVRVAVAGAGRARNTALELASTQVVCFTDDDCVVPPGWARSMTGLILERPEVALVFGTVIGARTIDDDLGYIPDFIIEREVELAGWGLDARVDRLGIGAGMAVRRTDVLMVGGFDPMMGPGSRFPSADDREIAIRLLLADRRVLMAPDPAVEHRGFRPIGAAARAHSQRDHVALGAMLAKMVDVDPVRGFGHLLVFLFVSSVQVVSESVRSRRPTGFGKLKWTVVGFSDGRRHPRLEGKPIFVDDLAVAVS